MIHLTMIGMKRKNALAWRFHALIMIVIARGVMDHHRSVRQIHTSITF